MTTRTAERVDDWESRPFSGGYEGLQALAEESFSGVVIAGRATCCLLNGTVVGILDGSIDDFEDAEGTARKAPTPALPLLLVMQDRADEVRAKYYSEETALSAADQKLSDGGFTGFIELSENVLSGDYYTVYHGGRSMSVAFVGESQKLLTDDEAFERADDEVGIYKVYPVDIDPIDIPEPEPEPEATTAAAGVGTETDDTEPDESADAETEDEPDDAPEERSAETDAPEGGVAHREDAPVEDDETTTSEDPATPETTDEASTDDSRADSREPDRERSTRDERTGREDHDARTGREDRQERTGREGSEDRERASTREENTSRQQAETRERPERRETRSERESRERRQEERGREREQRSESGQQQSHETGPDAGRSQRRTDSTRTQERQSDPLASGTDTAEPDRATPDTDPLAEPPADDDGAAVAAGAGGSGDLERRSIPSVDPDRTWKADEDDPSTPTQTTFQPAEAEPEPTTTDPVQSQPSPRQTEEDRARNEERSRQQTQPDPAQPSEDVVAELREKEDEIESLERELADLEREAEDLRDERAELEAELDRVRGERDDLQAEVQRLESKVEDLQAQASEDSTGPTAGTQLSTTEAIDGTNLFVRYGSKGEATLEAAHDGRADKDAVEANLDLEYHTQFDQDDTAVDGQPFESFLTGTIQYQFVDWVVHDLLYEIRDTGHEGALRDLFDALPKLDRAELNGAVSIKYTEDGEEHRTQEHFDIVLRDRMGNPLAVANINDSREAATGDMMSSLVTEATRVGESNDSLVGAFFVTSSFFDPEALETASEATGGGLLSRDKRESFVRLSRKQGYHLCLVEARDEKFHLAVPEL